LKKRLEDRLLEHLPDDFIELLDGFLEFPYLDSSQIVIYFLADFFLPGV
jgi:hypothetical protein